MGSGSGSNVTVMPLEELDADDLLELELEEEPLPEDDEL